MRRIALLICEELDGPALNITKILDLFSISWERVGPAALCDRAPAAADSRYGVICSIPLLGRMLMDGLLADQLPLLLTGAESIFLYGGDRSAATEAVVRLFTRCVSASVVQITATETRCSVSDQLPALCGPLSGMQVDVPVRGPQFAVSSYCAAMSPVISTNEGCVFGYVSLDGTRWYLATCQDVIDISRPLEREYFDVADHFFSAVPLVMYLRHEFREVIPQPVEQGACVIVDDLVLSPQYGSVNFSKIAALVGEHNFSCNIAFIPWNWKRSRPAVVDLFKRHGDRLSISIHGCDHTALEFAASGVDAINARTKLAKSRMAQHRKRTGLEHDELMVFPQGRFSSVAPEVLKHNGFIAAVNTKVSPVDSPSATEIAETWQMAVLKYAGFAIYTRRYTFHGLHNFAFDLMLGKPCLVATHHSDFRNDGRDLAEFIDRLNALGSRLMWRPLVEVIRRSYQSHLSDGIHRISMFGNEIMFENDGSRSCNIAFEKLEHNPTGIDHVEVAGRQVAFVHEKDLLRFEAVIGPRERALIRVEFKNIYGDSQPDRSVWRQTKVVARRYLSELRDESQARAPVFYKYAGKARNWWTGSSHDHEQ